MKIWLPTIRGDSGADVFTRRLAQALRRRGIEVEVSWFSTTYQFAPFLLRTFIPPPGTQIIHANSWSGFAFKRPGIPLVVTEHLNVFEPSYRPYKSLAQHIYHETLIRRYVAASLRAASAITTVSHSLASSFAKTWSHHPVQVIHNWIDTKAFVPPGPDANHGLRPFRLLYIGNFSRRKGTDLLPSIMKELGPDFELHFTSGLRGAEGLPLAENMVPLGRISQEGELIRAYHRCDALLFPSRLEGLPLAPLEAMSCGRPVVAANTSSLPEVIEDQVTGILCPPDDVGAFVAACRKLADYGQVRRQYGQAARRRAEELFSEERIIPQYMALYARVLEGTP